MHPNNYVGLHAFLAWCPIWALALILYFAFDVVMHVGRDRLEGLGYQVAYCAKIGDAGLMGAVLIAATILQRGNVVLPAGFVHLRNHLYLIMGLLMLGWWVNEFTRGARSAQKMDKYHDMVIAPFIAYCGVTLVPVIIRGGTFREKFAVLLLVLLWVLTLVVDIWEKRLDQRTWLRDHLGLRLR